MKKDTMKRISNIIFWATTGFAVITLIIVAKDYFTIAQEGVCIINKNDKLIYIALALLIVSMIVTSILDHKVKSMEKDEKPITDIYDQTLEVLKQEELKQGEINNESESLQEEILENKDLK